MYDIDFDSSWQDYHFMRSRSANILSPFLLYAVEIVFLNITRMRGKSIAFLYFIVLFISLFMGGLLFSYGFIVSTCATGRSDFPSKCLLLLFVSMLMFTNKVLMNE